MKQGYLLRAGSLVMALIITVGSLAACSVSSEDGSASGGLAGTSDIGSGGNSVSPLGKNEYEIAALAKEYVYHFEEVNLPSAWENGFFIAATGMNDDRLYLLLEITNWSDTGNRYDYYLVSMNKDGTDLHNVLLEMPAPKAFGSPEREEETSSEILERAIFEQFVINNGQIYAKENYSYHNYNPENTVIVDSYYICSWDLGGALLWETELEGLETEEEYLYVSTITGNLDGSLSMYLSGNAFYRWDVSSDGSLEEKSLLAEEIGEVIGNSQCLFRKSDGTFIVLYRDEYDWTQFFITYNPENAQLGEPIETPSFFTANRQTMAPSQNYDLMYGDDRGLYGYNVGDESSIKLMDYINSDVDISFIDTLLELDEHSFFCIYENDLWETKMGIFTYVIPEDIPDKKVLVMAGIDIDTYVRRRVLEFNRNSQEYRIVLKDYSERDITSGNLDDSVIQLNLDIISGDMPDILIADGLPVKNYASKGLLADIGEMIENDPELSQVEFVENVFDAYSMGGTLYYVIPYLVISTMIAKSNFVGDRTSWTMADMQELQDSLPEGVTMFGDGVAREDYLYWLFRYCGADFVDIDTGKCNFNTPGFTAAMEFGKLFPMELPPEYWDNYDWMVQQSAYRENRTVMYSAGISGMRDLKYALNGYMGDDVSFIGFPSDSGQGSVVNLYTSYCIFAKSANREGAWEFLRYYLTEEYQYQEALNNGLSIRKDVLEDAVQKAMERPYWLDSVTGEKDEYDDTIYMNGEDIIVQPLTQEQADQCLDFIYSVNKLSYNNWDVWNIINEELESFYSGQKSAQEVAGIIQNRVQLFVDENS